jgi:hypothetical protein
MHHALWPLGLYELVFDLSTDPMIAFDRGGITPSIEEDTIMLL